MGRALQVFGVTVLLLLSFLNSRAYAASLEVTIGVGDNILEISGWTSPSADVTVSEGGSTIGSTTANGSGLFEVILTGQTTGLRNIKVYARDSKDRLSDVFSDTINVTAHAVTELEVFLPPTIELSSNSLRQGEGLSVAGETQPNATVAVRIDNNENFTTASNASGKWQITVPTAGLYVGTHHLFAFTNAGGGLISEPTASRAFVVLTPDGAAEPPARDIRLSKPIITFPADGFRTAADTVVVKGVADANVQIELWSNGEVVGSAFSNSRGEWQISFQGSVAMHELTARACQRSRCGSFSDQVTIYFLNLSDEQGLSLSLDEYRYYNIKLGRPFSIAASFQGGDAPYELLVEWGDGSTSRFSEETAGTLTIDHRYDILGLLNGKVSVIDASGRQADRYFSVEVNEGGINVAYIWIPFGAAGIGLLIWRFGWRPRATSG